MKLVYLALGSNLGDREAVLAAALDRLNQSNLKLVRSSSLYETEPIGRRNQGWFLNLVAEFETELFPVQLLRRTQGIELEFGRKRLGRNGPRTLDIDIILFGSAIIKTGDLEIPHPRYRERRFVLAPLAELSPELRDPQTGKTILDLLSAVRGQNVKRRR